MADHTRGEIKGRAKEATGAMTGHTKLKRRGRIDQASASAKDKISDAADAVTDAVDSERRHR